MSISSVAGRRARQTAGYPASKGHRPAALQLEDRRSVGWRLIKRVKPQTRAAAQLAVFTGCVRRDLSSTTSDYHRPARTIGSSPIGSRAHFGWQHGHVWHLTQQEHVPPPELIQLLYLRSCTRSKRRRCPAVQSTWVLSTTPPIRYAKSTAALKNAPTGSIATLLFDLCATREAESQPAGCRRNQRTVTLRFHFSAESHLTDHGGSSRRRRPQGASRHSLLRPKRLILGCSPDLT